MAQLAIDAAKQAFHEGVGVTVIDPRWVKPLPSKALLSLAQRHRHIVVIEDGIKHAGIASSISELLRENRIEIPVHSIGVPLEFIEHSKRNEILEQLGMTAQAIARDLVSWSSFTEEAKRFQREGSADHRPLH